MAALENAELMKNNYYDGQTSTHRCKRLNTLNKYYTFLTCQDYVTMWIVEYIL